MFRGLWQGWELCAGMGETKLQFGEVNLAGISQNSVFDSASGLVIVEQKSIHESHLSYMGKVLFFVVKLFEGNKKVACCCCLTILLSRAQD